MGGGSDVRRAGAQAGVVSDASPNEHDLIDIVTAFTGGILFELDREGRYLRVWTGNPALLVRPVEELLGRTVAEVLDGEAGERFHDAFRRVFDTGEPMVLDYALDVQAGRRTFISEIRPRVAPCGGRTVMLLVRDVTAAKELEAKLLQAERLAALGLLAASVGHEIRQPLAYVTTSLDLLERALDGNARGDHARTSLENIRSGARRIAEIAASLDLLAGRKTRTSSAVDVRRPLQAALDLCSSELSGVRVERSLVEVPLVSGDEGELCQVFANVLLNAAQSTARGAPNAVVRLSLTSARGCVRVSVTDEGSGIAPEHLPRIFDPFFTTKEEQRGTGLGLFITRGIVQAHGGSIEVTSSPERGTTFDVYLPGAPAPKLRKEPVTGVRPVVPPRPSADASLEPRRRLSLLVVDDEPRFLESLRLALEDMHDVHAHSIAADALEALERTPQRYDVVLCDLAMPGIDGATFYERMKALGLGDRFVLMTGGAFTERAAEFIARKVCPRIGKPFLLERLLSLLQDVTRTPAAS